jgi:hypothetical protein
MKIRIASLFAVLIALAAWSDDSESVAPVSVPPPTEVVAPPKVYLAPLEIGSTGVIVAPLAVLKDQSWASSPIPGSPNRDWRVGDDEYVFPWAEKGDRLIVLADPGDDYDPARLVHARMETGRYAGRKFKIERKAITAEN